MSTATLPRNATRVRLELPETDTAVISRALERGIRQAIGDPAAVVCWYWCEEIENIVVTVKQVHGTWWALMPSGLTEMIGGYAATSTMHWFDNEPPKADGD